MRKLLGIGIGVFVLSMLATACSKAADEPKEGLEVGDRFPEYETLAAKTIDGDEIALKDYKGKVLFVDLWASWCPPCRDELPYLKLVQDRYVGDKFKILGISLDTSIESLREMANDIGLKYPQICDGKRWDSPYAKKYVTTGIPTNYILDGNGVIVAKNVRGLAVEGHVAKALGLDKPAVHYAEVMDYLSSTEEPDIAKAIDMLDKALKADPKQPEFHFLAARLQFAQGDRDKAAEHLEAGLKNKDRVPALKPVLQAYALLARLRFDAGDLDRAIEMIDEAIAAINALDEKQKADYEPAIKQLEGIKAQWKSEASED